MRWLRQHLHPARAIALVGGPFDGEHFLAPDPPPRALQLTLGGDGRYQFQGFRAVFASMLLSHLLFVTHPPRVNTPALDAFRFLRIYARPSRADDFGFHFRKIRRLGSFWEAKTPFQKGQSPANPDE